MTIDGSKVPTTPAFGTLTLNQSYLSGRDTQFANPLTLQQISGASTQVGGGGFQTKSGQAENDEPITLTQPVYLREATAPEDTIKVGDVTFELPADTAVRFPDGSTRGNITLTVVENALLPVRLPGGLWASSIVQITPFGTTFSKGGRFRFPNPERYPAGAKLFICQFDQGERSNSLAQWIAPGAAVVSSDGQFIDTDSDTIKQGSFYFVVGVRQTTSVIGRVIEADKRSARRVRVRVRGQETLTDGNGAFLLRNVPVGGVNDILIAEATGVRLNQRIDHANSNRTPAVPNGITYIGLITLPDPNVNQPPALVIAPSFTATAGVQNDFAFYAFDFDDGRIPRLSVTGAAFATIIPGNLGEQRPTILRLTPSANQLGNFRLVVVATDGNGATTTRTVELVVNARALTEPSGSRK